MYQHDLTQCSFMPDAATMDYGQPSHAFFHVLVGECANKSSTTVFVGAKMNEIVGRVGFHDIRACQRAFIIG